MKLMNAKDKDIIETLVYYLEDFFGVNGLTAILFYMAFWHIVWLAGAFSNLQADMEFLIIALIPIIYAAVKR